MNWHCDFSIRHYKEVLKHAKKRYSFLTFSEFSKSKKQNNVILLRHDIDYSIDKAFEMAKIESKLGIKSTYFVLLRSSFYNPYSIVNTSQLKKIIMPGLYNKNEFKDNKDYIAAIEGKTKVDCFNEWVKELKENNYLHNHTRMWFASIWIFTLGYSWQSGANFFKLCLKVSAL